MSYNSVIEWLYILAVLAGCFSLVVFSAAIFSKEVRKDLFGGSK